MLREYLHALIWAKRHLLRQRTAPEIAWVKHFLSPSDICIDVGAHGGSWAIPLSRIVNRGHVYAYEALPYYAQVLKLTTRLLGRGNITIINRAVQEKKCRVPIVWHDQKGRRLTGCTHLAGSCESRDGTIEVEGVDLDSEPFLSKGQRIRFIKCDVEGAELLVFKGCRKILDEWKPFVYAEVDDTYCRRYGHSAEDVVLFLADHGYSPFTFSPNGQLDRQTLSPVPDQTDILFVPCK